MDYLNLKNSSPTFPVPEFTFKQWLGLVEAEQAKQRVMANVILNRQLLYHFWVTGYSPVEASNELQEDEENLSSLNKIYDA